MASGVDAYLLAQGWRYHDGAWWDPEGWPDPLTDEEALTIQRSRDSTPASPEG
jgi:hypothetical protein